MSEGGASTEPVEPMRQRSTIRWRRWALRGAFESVLIVLSVILALALTNWADDRRTAHRVAEMRGFLIQEIRANRAELATAYYIPHHERLKKIFARAGGTPEATGVTRSQAEPAIAALFDGGIHLMPTNNAVWTSFSSSDMLEHMEAEEVFVLAQTYRAQESLENTNRAGYENAVGLLDILTDEGDTHRQMLRMTIFLEDLIQQETNLLRLYDGALERLDPNNAHPLKRPAAKGDGDATSATR